jgi:hypothetical protein
MCLIIVKPAGIDVSKQLIASALSYNPDGIGIMYHDGKIPVIRRYLTNKTLHSELLALNDYQVAIHFRQATHGRVDMANCHPFELPHSHGWLMHNGIISIRQSDKTKSDTWHFVQTIGKRLQNLETIVGPSNKLVIMSKNGKIDIIGEGVHYDGLWLSNTYAWDYPEPWDNWDTVDPLDYAVRILLETAQKTGLIQSYDDIMRLNSNELTDLIYQLEESIQ